MEFKLRDRKFGTELEFFGTTADKVLAELRIRGLAAQYEGYTHATTPYWKIVTDSSVNSSDTGQGQGLELVSPILEGVSGLRELELACEALAAAGAKVDKTCGLHVHHDAHDMDAAALRKLAEYYIRWQPVIDHLLAPSRRNNRNMCRPLGTVWEGEFSGTTAFEKAMEARKHYRNINSFPNRYHVINIKDAFGRHGTVEFRQHQGTLEYWKIEMWVLLTQNIVERAVAHSLRVSNCTTRLKAFRDGLAAIGTGLVDVYGRRASANMLRRFHDFNPDATVYTVFD